MFLDVIFLKIFSQNKTSKHLAAFPAGAENVATIF